jgi:hypothetical protein
MIFYYLQLRTDIDPYIAVPGPTDYRRVCDLNRFYCRATPYRNELTKFMAENRKRIGMVADVHSFPPDYADFGEAYIVLLDNDVEKTGEFSDYTEDLRQRLNDAGIRTNALFGSTIVAGNTTETNDIQDEAKIQFGLPSLLIEFNELFFLPEMRDEWEQSVQVIADWAAVWATKYVSTQNSPLPFS